MLSAIYEVLGDAKRLPQCIGNLFIAAFPIIENEGPIGDRSRMAGAGRKPNSVPANGEGGYLSEQPTRPSKRAVSTGANSVLLRMGFTVLLMSPSER